MARSRPNRGILLACMPKSGSSFTRYTNSQLSPFESVDLARSYGQREQELDGICLFETCTRTGRALRIARCLQRRDGESLRPALRLLGGRRIISQHHVRYSTETERLINRYDLTTVVLIRRLDDAVFSLKDYLEDPQQRFNPWALIPDTYRNMTDAERETFIVQLVMPWYVHFFFSWWHYFEHGGTMMFATYEDMAADPVRCFGRILAYFDPSDHLGINDELTIKTAMESVSAVDAKLNVGRVGRGDAICDHALLRLGEKLAHYAPSKRQLDMLLSPRNQERISSVITR